MSIFSNPVLTGIAKASASGPIASFSDGAKGLPLRSLLVDIDPVQDLHGYDNPWPAGGGKNKLQVTATSNTINGVTFTVNSDGTILVNGTADADAFFILSDATFLRDSPSGTYVLTGCPSGGSTLSYNLDVRSASGADIGNGILIEYTNLTYANVRIRVYSGTSCNNLLFKPMIRLASVTDATFAPYSNICPISGHTEVNAWRTGKNLLPYPYYTQDGTIDGVTWETETDGKITGSGTTERGTNFFFSRSLLLKAGTYTLSVTGIHEGMSLIVWDLTEDVLKIRINSNETAKNFTFAVDSTVWVYFNIGSASVNVNINAYIQLEEGSSASPYSPYSGNQYTITFPQIYANIWDEEWENGSINTSTGEILPAVSAIISKNRIPVVPGEIYCFVKPSGVQGFGFFYDSNNNPVQYVAQTGNASVYNLTALFGNSTDYKFTVPAGATNMLFRVDGITVYNHNISINYPSTDTQYHPYNTVYGGTLTVNGDGSGTLTVNGDGSGTLVVDRASVDLGTLTWVHRGEDVAPGMFASSTFTDYLHSDYVKALCSIYSYKGTVNAVQQVPQKGDKVLCLYYNSRLPEVSSLYVYDTTYTDAATFKAAMSGVQLVYELATPITYQLTPTEIMTLLGQNNIWADTGDVDVEYLKQSLNYIGSYVH